MYTVKLERALISHKSVLEIGDLQLKLVQHFNKLGVCECVEIVQLKIKHRKELKM